MMTQQTNFPVKTFVAFLAACLSACSDSPDGGSRDLPSVTPPAGEDSSQKNALSTLPDEGGMHSRDVENFWNEAHASWFTTSFPNGNAPEVIAGRMIPPEIHDLRGSQLLDALTTGTLQGIEDENSRTSARRSFQQLVEMCMRGEMENLAKLVAVRANQVPPSRGDVILFLMLREALPALENEQGSAHEWLGFADATNPIYRLLAIQVVKRAKGIGDDLAGQFFKRLANDFDDTIARAALKGIETLPAAKAIPLLEQLRLSDGPIASRADLINDSFEVVAFRVKLENANLGP